MVLRQVKSTKFTVNLLLMSLIYSKGNAWINSDTWWTLEDGLLMQNRSKTP